MSLTSSPEYYLTELGQKISLLNHRIEKVEKRLEELTIINKRIDEIIIFMEEISGVKFHSEIKQGQKSYDKNKK